MKTNLLRFLAVLCAMLMVLCSAVACNTPDENPDGTTEGGTTTAGGTTSPGGTTGTTASGDVTTTEDPDVLIEAFEREEYALEQEDMNGYIYRMMLDSGVYIGNYGPVEDLEETEVINLALMSRNEYLEEFYNIEILVENSSSSLSSMLPTKDSAGDNWADTIIGTAGGLMKSAVPNGYVLNLNNVNGLNLEASYWDQRIQTEYSIDNMVFALEGDFTAYDELRTHVVLYNGDLYTEYGYGLKYGSPYEVVRDGDWTLDVMLEMFKDRSDINSTPSLTNQHQWGLLSESIFPYVVFLGTGIKNIEVQRDGSLELLFSDPTQYQQTYDILEDVLKKVAINDEVLFADASNGVLTSGDIWTEVSNMFEADQALFRSTTLSAATRLANMESTFGILPVPKYSKTQKEYYSWCSSGAHTPMMVPATALSDIDTSAKITESICFSSKYMPNDQLTCVEAFYENMAVVKLCRTAEDYEMLQLIFSNKTFDLDATFGITGVYSTASSCSSGRDVSGLSHSLSSNSGSAQTALDKFLEDVVTKVQN